MQSIGLAAFDLMQSFLAMLTSSLILLEVASASVTPILVEEMIALGDSGCTFWCKPGLRVRLHLIRAMWNVGLHSNLKPFS